MKGWDAYRQAFVKHWRKGNFFFFTHENLSLEASNGFFRLSGFILASRLLFGLCRPLSASFSLCPPLLASFSL
jgi:hypothetical protein